MDIDPDSLDIYCTHERQNRIVRERIRLNARERLSNSKLRVPKSRSRSFSLKCERETAKQHATHLNSGLVQFGGPRQLLSAVYVRIMRFCKRRFQFCQLLLRNNWKAVVKVDFSCPAGNLDATRKSRANRNVIVEGATRAMHFVFYTSKRNIH